MLPIVLIHGFLADASMWEAQAAYLRGKGRQVITPNLPGVGGTPALPRGEWNIERYAEAMRRVIEREAGGRAIVGGFSMGGYTLLALLREHPEMVAAAMLLDTRAEADSPEAREVRIKSIADVEAHGPAGLIDTMLVRLLRKHPAEDVAKKTRAMMERQGVEGILSAQTAMSRRRDQTELLAELKIPVLIVVGDQDAITPPSVALAMQSHLAHGMLVQVAAAGHMSPMEQPDAVNKAIEAFLETVHVAE